MEFSDIIEVSVESAGSILLLVVAYKLFRLKCGTHSKCGDWLVVDLENPGTPQILPNVQMGTNEI